MKKITVLSNVLFVLCLQMRMFSQTTLDWGLATINAGVVTQTVDGVTATFSGGLIDTMLVDGNIITSSVVKTIVFLPTAIDIASVYIFDEANVDGVIWTLTPIGGDNTAVSQQVDAMAGYTVAVNWKGVTSFTLTNSQSLNSRIGIGNIEIPSSCLESDVPEVTFLPATPCSGDVSLLTITGDRNDATEWVVYSDLCGGNFVGSTTSNTIPVVPNSQGGTVYYVRGEGGCVSPGLCSIVNIVPTALDDASFSYPLSSYCLGGVSPVPTITGLLDGTFSSTTGLIIDPLTGIINPLESQEGTYEIVYTTSGSCPASSNFFVIINGMDDASFSYTSLELCANDGETTPIITGLPGGVFSSSVGLVLDELTGAVNASESEPGVYVVSYKTSGACSNESSVVITISELDDALFGYETTLFDKDGFNPVPVITGLSGGTFTSTAGLVIDAQTGEIDLSASLLGDYVVTYVTSGVCSNSLDVGITISTTLSIDVVSGNSNKLNIYNTGLNDVVISNLETDGVLRVYSIDGGLLFSKKVSKLNSLQTVNLEMLSRGFYIAQLITDKASIHKKIILN